MTEDGIFAEIKKHGLKAVT